MAKNALRDALADARGYVPNTVDPETELTPWHPPSMPPVREGVYEIRFPDVDTAFFAYMRPGFFEHLPKVYKTSTAGNKALVLTLPVWSKPERSVSKALMLKNEVLGYQPQSWRGVNKDLGT